MEQQQTTNWMDKELNDLDKQNAFDGERSPPMKFEDGKVVTITLDFSKQFDKYEDTENKATKAIIPINHQGEKKIWWLNVKNPLYKEIVRAGREGKTEFKILQSGKNKSTRYSIVEDETPATPAEQPVEPAQ